MNTCTHIDIHIHACAHRNPHIHTCMHMQTHIDTHRHRHITHIYIHDSTRKSMRANHHYRKKKK